MEQTPITELESHEFQVISSLFDGIEHNVALVYSVIEGNTPGRIFVDRPEAPSSAFLCPQDTFQYVGGSTANDGFNRALEPLIFGQLLPRMQEQELVLFAFSDAWRGKLDMLLRQRNAIRIQRKVFAFNPVRFAMHAGWRERMPAGLRIQYVDEQLVQKHPVYKPLIEPRTKRFGICLMSGDEIVSACSAVSVGRGEAEIDIYTVEEHRGQGFATLTACAFIEECLSRHLVPSWSCWPYREASCALAEKLGFEAQPDVPAHYWAKGM